MAVQNQSILMKTDINDISGPIYTNLCDKTNPLKHINPKQWNCPQKNKFSDK